MLSGFYTLAIVNSYCWLLSFSILAYVPECCSCKLQLGTNTWYSWEPGTGAHIWKTSPLVVDYEFRSSESPWYLQLVGVCGLVLVCLNEWNLVVRVEHCELELWVAAQVRYWLAFTNMNSSWLVSYLTICTTSTSILTTYASILQTSFRCLSEVIIDFMTRAIANCEILLLVEVNSLP